MMHIPGYVITFVTMLVHLWTFIHAHIHGLRHHMPRSYVHHMRLLNRQLGWFFRHISGKA